MCGLLSTVVPRVLLGPVATKVSKNGSVPYSDGSSSVKWMCVLVVDMLKTLVTVFCLIDNKRVINIT